MKDGGRGKIWNNSKEKDNKEGTKGETMKQALREMWLIVLLCVLGDGV